MAPGVPGELVAADDACEDEDAAAALTAGGVERVTLGVFVAGVEILGAATAPLVTFGADTDTRGVETAGVTGVLGTETDGVETVGAGTGGTGTGVFGTFTTGVGTFTAGVEIPVAALAAGPVPLTGRESSRASTAATAEKHAGTNHLPMCIGFPVENLSSAECQNYVKLPGMLKLTLSPRQGPDCGIPQIP